MTAVAMQGASNVIHFARKRQQALFTCRDLLELNEWDSRGRRVEVDRCEDLSGLGQFAMIYGHDEPWASWAVSREGARILLWDCITLADVGRFETMRETLAAVPGPWAAPAAVAPEAEVIPFPASTGRRSAA